MSEYLPIASYGVVGNQETCALVGQNGSIDWLPLPYLDSASVFAGILDAESGGHFQLRPTEFDESYQQYVDETAVLETIFETDDGTLSVVDFIPPIADHEDDPHRALYRKVTCDGGPMQVEMEFQPRFDYARTETELAAVDGGLIATGHHDWLFLSMTETPQVEDETVRTVFSMDDDESRWFVVRYNSQSPVPDAACKRQLADTVEHWRDRTHDCPDDECSFAGQWHDLAVRSGIILKMLAARETGAIAAAPTTSLPEDLGGVRNWDYRFNWIRDSASVAMILYALGYSEVGEDYHNWFLDLCAVNHPKDLQPVQGLHGDTNLQEEELDNLSGYRDSTPVRIGNEAASQTQLDTYGELVLAIDQTAQQEGGVSEDRWDDIATVVDYVCECWDEKGSGVWEIQTDPKHYTHSKLMCWVALDRGINMAQRQEFDAPLDRWRNHREQIRSAIQERGYSDDRRSFVQTFGGDDALDATSILIPIMGFLPFDDDRVQNTLDAIIKTLTTDDGLVRRYNTDDGLPGSDGGFLRASFWLVNALALSGRIEEADRMFDAIVEQGNSLGLFSEEIDLETNEYLGNYPQAYSHVGLASSIVYLNYVHGQEMSSEPLGVRLGSGGILDDR